MIPPFIKGWSDDKLQALYNAQKNKRDPFFKHPRDMMELRELVSGRERGVSGDNTINAIGKEMT